MCEDEILDLTTEVTRVLCPLSRREYLVEYGPVGSLPEGLVGPTRLGVTTECLTRFTLLIITYGNYETTKPNTSY